MKRPTNIEDIVQHCLDRLGTGDDVSSCLRDFPEHADVLAPLLEVAVGLRGMTLPTLPAPVREAARLRARAALPKQSTTHHRTRTPWRWNAVPRWGVAVAFALLLVLGTFGGSVVAAQGSVPGDRFYGLKRSSEELHVWLTPDARAKARLYLSFADRRLAESLALLTSGTMPPSSTISEIEQNYELARELIKRAPPAEQVVLQQHYNRTVLDQRQQLESAHNQANAPDAHALLEDALRANIANQMFDDLTPGAAPTASASPLRTRQPTRSSATPTRVEPTSSVLVTPEESVGTAQPASSSTAQLQPSITVTRGSTPGANSATTTVPAVPTTPPSSSTPPPIVAPFRTAVPTPATDLRPTVTDGPVPTAAPVLTEEPPPTRPATPTREAVPTAGSTPTEEWPTHETQPTDEAKPTDEPGPTDEVPPTGEPTHETQPTDEVRPTDEAHPTDEPKPTDDARPTDESRPTDEPKPTKDLEPTDNARPTDESRPTDEPKPTKDPKPTDEPKPTKDPKPTDEPKPTKDKDGKN